MAQPPAAGKAGASLEMPRLGPAWGRLFPPSLPSRPTPPQLSSVTPHCPQKTA